MRSLGRGPVVAHEMILGEPFAVRSGSGSLRATRRTETRARLSHPAARRGVMATRREDSAACSTVRGRSWGPAGMADERNLRGARSTENAAARARRSQPAVVQRQRWVGTKPRASPPGAGAGAPIRLSALPRDELRPRRGVANSDSGGDTDPGRAHLGYGTGSGAEALRLSAARARVKEPNATGSPCSATYANAIRRREPTTRQSYGRRRRHREGQCCTSSCDIPEAGTDARRFGYDGKKRTGQRIGTLNRPSPGRACTTTSSASSPRRTRIRRSSRDTTGFMWVLGR